MNPAYEDLMGNGLEDGGVAGIVIAPGSGPIAEPYNAVVDLFGHAKQWGWLGNPALKISLAKIAGANSESSSLNKLLDELLVLSQESPEVFSMLNEIKRVHGYEK